MEQRLFANELLPLHNSALLKNLKDRKLQFTGRNRTSFLLQITHCKKDSYHIETVCFGPHGPEILKWTYYTNEQTIRLYTRRNNEHKREIASSQSRDPWTGKYAGTIVVSSDDDTEIYFAVAGIEERASEALAYFIAEFLGLQVPSGYSEMNDLFRTVRSCVQKSLSV